MSTWFRIHVIIDAPQIYGWIAWQRTIGNCFGLVRESELICLLCCDKRLQGHVVTTLWRGASTYMNVNVDVHLRKGCSDGDDSIYDGLFGPWAAPIASAMNNKSLCSWKYIWYRWDARQGIGPVLVPWNFESVSSDRTGWVEETILQESHESRDGRLLGSTSTRVGSLWETPRWESMSSEGALCGIQESIRHLALRKVRASPPTPYHQSKYSSSESTSGYEYSRNKLDGTPKSRRGLK